MDITICLSWRRWNDCLLFTTTPSIPTDWCCEVFSVESCLGWCYQKCATCWRDVAQFRRAIDSSLRNRIWQIWYHLYRWSFLARYICFHIARHQIWAIRGGRAVLHQHDTAGCRCRHKSPYKSSLLSRVHSDHVLRFCHRCCRFIFP